MCTLGLHGQGCKQSHNLQPDQIRKVRRAPDILAFSYHAGLTTVNARSDHQWHLQAVIVPDTLLDQLSFAQAVNGRREDDEAADVPVAIRRKNGEINVSVWLSVRKGVDSLERRVGITGRVKISVDVGSRVATVRFLRKQTTMVSVFSLRFRG